MGGIVAGLGMILAKIAGALEWIGNLFKAVFVALADFGKDMVAWVFDEVLGLVLSMLNALDFTALTQHAATWAGLPTGVKEVIAAIGLGTAFGIIVSAIGIRMLLQLVPFTRLGS